MLHRPDDDIKYQMDNKTLVAKSHIEDFTTQTQLIVHESQEALFYKEGRALDLFAAGRYALSTENLPVLRHFFGARTPFSCEVFFINKVSVLDLLWGIPTPIVLEDPRYHLIVHVRASGQTGVRVKDSRRFVVKVVGQLTEFTVEDVRRSVKGMMMTSLNTLIANTIVNEGVSILEVTTRLEDLSVAVRQRLNEKLDDIGLEAVHFNIGTIFADEADLAKLREAKMAVSAKRIEAQNDAEMEAYKIELMGKARASARAAEGYTYQDERRFDVLSAAAGNAGAAGSLVNAGVGLGMGLGVMGEIRHQTNAALAQDAAPTKVCPDCGAQVAADAKFCSGCGKTLAPAGKTCPQCHASVAADAKFCQACGKALAPAKKFCPSCGAENEGTCLFCSACGHKFA